MSSITTEVKRDRIHRTENCVFMNDIDWEGGKIDAVISPKYIKNIPYLMSSKDGTIITLRGYTVDGERGPKFIAKHLIIDEDDNTMIEVPKELIREAAEELNTRTEQDAKVKQLLNDCQDIYNKFHTTPDMAYGMRIMMNNINSIREILCGQGS